MTINEAIAGQDIQVLFERLKLEQKWHNFVGACRVGLGLRYDDKLSKIKPESIIRLCEDAGYTTLEKLQQDVDSNNVNLMPLMAREPNIGNCLIVTHDFLRDAIQRTNGYIADEKIRWFDFDGKFKLINKAQLDKILLYIADKSVWYVPTKYDCEDFQREILGWLAKVGLGNCSIGTMGTFSYNNSGQFIGGHYGCVVVYMDGTEKVAKFLEPQTGKLHDLGDPKIGGFLGTATVKVFDCGF